MIRYALNCSHDHGFEGWFKSGAAFEQQVADGQLACPACGDRAIRKAVMAPAVRRSAERAPEAMVPAEAAPSAPPVPSAAPTPEQAAMMLAVLRKLRAHVEQNFDNVGDRFPEEVRRMHYGEAEERNVFGQASLEEAKELIEEGIPVRPLPDLPKLDG